jgi:hypothetical protein
LAAKKDEIMSPNSLVQSYISPKIVIKKSRIHGLGMFAQENIDKGEIVFIKGGHIVKRSALYSSEQIDSYLPIDDDFFIGAKCREEEERIKLFINHACDPNCGMRGEITFIALRVILSGEELTCDYAMIDNEAYQFECHCSSPNCRRIITGFDWRMRELQVKYSGYFARYLSEKMKT